KNDRNYNSGNIQVRPFPVIHKEYLHDRTTTRQVHALVYIYTLDGLNICNSVHTAYCEDLVEQAKDADLAIIEAGHDEDTPDEMHMTLNEAKSIGESAKEYFLVHVPE